MIHVRSYYCGSARAVESQGTMNLAILESILDRRPQLGKSEKKRKEKKRKDIVQGQPYSSLEMISRVRQDVAEEIRYRMYRSKAGEHVRVNDKTMYPARRLRIEHS
jgi:hypothetical protein